MKKPINPAEPMPSVWQIVADAFHKALELVPALMFDNEDDIFQSPASARLADIETACLQMARIMMREYFWNGGHEIPNKQIDAALIAAWQAKYEQRRAGLSAVRLRTWLIVSIYRSEPNLSLTDAITRVTDAVSADEGVDRSAVETGFKRTRKEGFRLFRIDPRSMMVSDYDAFEGLPEKPGRPLPRA